MLWTASTLNGYAIEATDGEIGTVSDLLFEDRSWIVRWLVAETGSWLSGRKVLLPLAALGEPDAAHHHFPIALTMRKLQDSPAFDADQPVSRRLEAQLYKFYGWNPNLGSGSPSTENPVPSASGPPLRPSASPPDSDPVDPESSEADPHLRSMSAVTGFRIEATDGEIGHVEGVLVEANNWHVRYIIVSTRNWWPGKKVLISPRSVTMINGPAGHVHLDITRAKIQGGPQYDPTIAIDDTYNESFLTYYGIKWVAW